MRLLLGALAALGWFAAGHLLLAKLYRPAPAGKPATVTMLTSLPLRWATGGGMAAMIAQGAGEDPALLRLEAAGPVQLRSAEHTSELQSLMRTSYAVFRLNNKN